MPSSEASNLLRDSIEGTCLLWVTLLFLAARNIRLFLPILSIEEADSPPVISSRGPHLRRSSFTCLRFFFLSSPPGDGYSSLGYQSRFFSHSYSGVSSSSGILSLPVFLFV